MGANTNTVDVRLLGTLEVLVDGVEARFRTKKTAQLLAYLVTRQGDAVSRDLLAETFWPDAGQDSARQSLRMSLSDIRAVLGLDPFTGGKDSVTLVPGLVGSDHQAFMDLASEAHGSPNELEVWSAAIGLVAGPLLDGHEAPWAVHLWLRIQEILSFGIVRLLEISTAADKWQRAALEANRVLEIVGCREEIHAALIKLYLAQGLTSRAIQQFEALETELDEHWGERPSQATVRLLEEAPQGATLAGTALVTLMQNRDGIVGRQDTLSQLERMLVPGKAGQVTLLGTGGAGKTTIARALSRRWQEAGHTAHFVDLSAESTPDGTVHAIQAALEIPVTGRAEGPAAIGRRLAAQPTLVVLDNLEQLAEICQGVLEAVLAASGATSFLFTSRVATDLASERTLQVEPMSVPTRVGPIPEMRAHDSIVLFEKEAERSNPGFRVSPSNIAAVVELVKALDGLPLAISLAASRMLVFTPAEVLSRVKDSSKWLKSDFLQGEERHASLFNAIDWSFGLLGAEARALALALSTFRSPVGAPALARVAGLDAVEEPLIELVRSSLAVTQTSGASATYSTYETVRKFLDDRLDTSDTRDRFRTAHLEYWASRTAETVEDSSMREVDKTRWGASHTADILAAAQYGLESPENREKSALLVTDLVHLLQPVGSATGITEVLKALTEMQADLTDKTYATVLNSYVFAMGNILDVSDMAETLGKAVRLSDGDDKLTASIRLTLGGVYKSAGEYEKADREYQAAREIYERLGLVHGLAQAYYHEALNAYCVSNKEKNREYLLVALDLIRQTDSPSSTIRILFDNGSLACDQGDFERGFDLFDEALELCSQVDSLKLEGLTRWLRGDGLLRVGRSQEGLEEIRSAVNLVVSAGFQAGVKWIFIRLAQALHDCGSADLAAKWLAWGRHTRESEDRALADYEVRSFDAALSDVTKALGQTKLERFMAEGRRTDWQTLVQETNALAKVPSPANL